MRPSNRQEEKNDLFCSASRFDKGCAVRLFCRKRYFSESAFERRRSEPFADVFFSQREEIDFRRRVDHPAQGGRSGGVRPPRGALPGTGLWDRLSDGRSSRRRQGPFPAGLSPHIRGGRRLPRRIAFLYLVLPDSDESLPRSSSPPVVSQPVFPFPS